MKLIVAGTRTVPLSMAKRILRAHWSGICIALGRIPSRLVSGGSGGVDRAAMFLARELTGRRAIVVYAEWKRYGRSAGPRRNRVMAERADALVVIWDGRSRGTFDMQRAMRFRRKRVLRINVKL